MNVTELHDSAALIVRRHILKEIQSDSIFVRFIQMLLYKMYII